MSANTRAAGRGTIRKAEELYPPDVLVEKLIDHGLCVTCNAQLFEVTGIWGQLWGRRKLNPVTTPGVSMNGRCLYCHPEQESHSVKEEEEQNWEDAATVSIEEVETGEDSDGQPLPPVISLDGLDEERFVGVVLEGNTKKGKGIFHYVEETGEHKGKSMIYEGEFADGFFEGRGSLRDEGVGYVSEGQWKKSKRHGHIKETFKIGDMYEGEIKNDMRDGHGTYTEATGNRYEGEWKNDTRNGNGKMFYTTGDGGRYEGEWKNNLMNGNGKRVFEDGDVYEGNWKDDEFDGQGTYTWADGDHYEGEFKNDMMNGNGKRVDKDGDMYKGNWKDDEFDGQGTYTWADGGRYEGEWKIGLTNGNGKRVYKNGTIFEGNWKDDEKDGRGILRYASGRGEVGTWKKDKFVR
eukprot:scaffold8672_cov50-Attheya_sp.AAC.4